MRLNYEDSVTFLDLAEDEELSVRPGLSVKVIGSSNELAGFLIRLGKLIPEYADKLSWAVRFSPTTRTLRFHDIELDSVAVTEFLAARKQEQLRVQGMP